MPGLRENGERSRQVSLNVLKCDCHFVVPGGIMKLVAEYLVDAIKFDRMAEDATDMALKASFRKQAAEYRKLALSRAKRFGMPPPDVSPEPKTDEA